MLGRTKKITHVVLYNSCTCNLEIVFSVYIYIYIYILIISCNDYFVIIGGQMQYFINIFINVSFLCLINSFSLVQLFFPPG